MKPCAPENNVLSHIESRVSKRFFRHAAANFSAPEKFRSPQIRSYDARRPRKAATLEEFAQKLRTGRSLDEKREALLHTMACKASIKGGWTSDPAELKVLVEKVQSGEARYCPHGRPVVVKIRKYELEKLFKRA